jgi:hypothetical protein
LIFDANLEWSAKEAGKDEAKTARFWFRRKYGLTATDPRYLDMTEEGMLSDYWAHYYYDKPESEFEADTENYDDEVAAMEAEIDVDDLEDISHGEPSAD